MTDRIKKSDSKPSVAPSFVRKAASHKQEKRERRAVYRGTVNRFKVKKGKDKVKGVRQTAVMLGFVVVEEIGRPGTNGRWSYKRRLVKHPWRTR